MKLCRQCGNIKDLTKFSKNRSRPDGLNSYCKTCHSHNRKLHYANNKDKIIGQVVKRRNELKRYVTEYKRSKGCALCEENEPVCLDLHHKDPSTKTIESARLFMTGWKLDRINEELAKCEVLCANCHRKLHHATLA